MKGFGTIFMVFLGLCISAPVQADAIQILAASSLTEAMREATKEDDVSLGFGASGRIATQILAGAPVDIVALAHPQWLQALRDEGIVARSESLLGNRLVVAVRKGELAQLQNLHTLHHADRIGIGSEGTPAGLYARQAIGAVGLTERIAANLHQNSNVRAVLAHLSTGTTDAAFVYQTDLSVVPEIESRFVVDPGLHDPIQLSFVLTKTGAAKPNAVQVFENLCATESLASFVRQGFTRTEPKPMEALNTPAATPPLQTQPVRLSLWVGGLSVLLSLVPALGLGWLLARRDFFGKSMLSTLCLAPLVLPPVVTGWLLLQALVALGLPIAFTRWAAVLAASVVGFPLLLILTRQAIESVDIRYPKLAESLGLHPFAAFVRVTLPMALPGIIAGCVLAFARALGEFGATAMLAGDHPEETRTLALAVYALTEQPGGTASAATLVGVSVVITLCALVAYERLVWHKRTANKGAW